MRHRSFQLGESQATCLLRLAFAVCLGSMVYVALQRGTWIDEYWTQWQTDPDQSAIGAYLERWLPDVGHPPLFNSIHWAVAQFLDMPVRERRFLNGLLGAFVVLPTLWFISRRFASAQYRWLLLLLVFASPFVLHKFGEHRAYFVGVCSVLSFLLTLREVTLLSLSGQQVPKRLLAWLTVMLLGASNLDYTNFVVTHSALGCVAAGLWYWGHRRVAMFLMAAGAAAAVLLIAQLTAAIQLGHTTPSSQVPMLKGLAALGFVFLSSALPGLPLLAPVARRLASWPNWASNLADRSRTRFILILGAATIITGAGFVAVQLASAALLARHALPAVPLIAMFIVEIATSRRLNSPVVLQVAITSAAVSLVSALFSERFKGWEAFAPLLAAETRRCPTSFVIAIEPGLLLTSDGRSPYVGMNEAVSGSYIGVAQRWKLPIVLAQAGRKIEPARRCPTLLWMEHNFGRPSASTADIVRVSGLAATQQQVGAARRINGSPTSTVLIIPATASGSARGTK